MTKKLQHWFALSEKGARDLVKAVLWCFVCNLALMFPVGAVLFTVQHLLGCLEGGGSPTDGFWLYVGFALAVLVLLFVLHWFQYASLYIATYRESANRRVSLAETLRRLPLSFFGNRDLSDLTSTMIADCSSLDQMFSHYVPQLFASVGSTLVIGACMFACDWRMALAVLWVVPVAVALTAGSKKIQDAFGTKNILNKRAVADCIQEGLETIRDIKACHRQERYLGDLETKLAAMEGSSIRSELATGVFVCSAQAFLRLGLATTVLTGGALLLAGELSFLYFLGFLFAAARLYDPLGVVLQNIAATFNTKLQIERMRSILEQPVQTGTEDFRPSRYDITFDHVSFAYREGAGVLEDVSFTARQGEVTALIGPSGGGKSTACKLGARFWDVTGGKVLLGGTDVSTVDPETLLRSYSMVFQDVVLFRDTVMENIRLGRRGATDEEVLEAAKAAQCDEFIRKLPQGYQTVIGGERLHPLRRGAAADLHRPGPVEGRAGGAAGRGHRQPGRGERKRRPDRPLPPAPGQDGAGHRPPDAHRGRGRPHRSAGERPCGPAGHPGGADGAGRPLPPHGGAPERERPVAAERCGGIAPFETGQKRARLNGAVPFCDIPAAGSRTAWQRPPRIYSDFRNPPVPRSRPPAVRCLAAALPPGASVTPAGMW